ncbi:MAG: DUF429 domain-containing protein [Fusobacteriales bacterium]|jgi:predicted RNase H-like nuclease|nr:DUF429 domain-containing protein [Fusobacteriales bacterium]
MKEKIFAGIDLAWTEDNETGICIINGNGEIIFSGSDIYSNNYIAGLFLNSEMTVRKEVHIGIDAPLVFPENSQEYRNAEKDLKRTKINGFHISSFQVSKEYMERAYKGSRGEDIAGYLVKKYKKFNYTDKIFTHSHEVVETFPTGITAGIFPEIFPAGYKLKGKISDSLKGYIALYEKIKIFEEKKIISGFTENFELPENNLKRKDYKKFEDKIDAFLCAFGLFLVYKNLASELYFGDIKKGLIFLPLKQ